MHGSLVRTLHSDLEQSCKTVCRYKIFVIYPSCGSAKKCYIGWSTNIFWECSPGPKRLFDSDLETFCDCWSFLISKQIQNLMYTASCCTFINVIAVKSWRLDSLITIWIMVLYTFCKSHWHMPLQFPFWETKKMLKIDVIIANMSLLLAELNKNQQLL